MKKLFGIVTAMVTPVDVQSKPLMHSVSSLTDYLIAQGVQCLYPLGSTGEMILMEDSQREQVAQRVIDTAGGRVPVYVHVAAPTTSRAVKLARHAYKAGADGVAALTPIYYDVTESENFDYFAAIAASLPEDFPIYLYNLPQCSCNDISVSLCNRLTREFPNIVGIKYSYPDLKRTREYMTVKNGAFSVLHGSDMFFDAFMSMGCDGIVSGLSNAFPAIFNELYDAFLAHDLLRLKAAQERVNTITRILLKGNGIANIKAVLEILGFEFGTMIPPLQAVSSKQKQALAAELRAAQLLS